MKELLAYPLSALYWILFGITLLIFHPIQMICRLLGGYTLRKKSVDVFNFILVYGQLLLGTRIRFTGFHKLPKGRPLIILSNHQNFFDIPPIVLGFRKHHPKFVSKMELGKGIPSVSYNLRHGGSALIDRKNGRQSIVEISKLGKHIEKEKYSASIFPEGTRSKTGEMRAFQHAGVATLMRAAPSALLVPFVIDGHNRICAKGYFPLSLGTKITYTVLDPIDPAGRDAKELTEEIEGKIRSVQKV